MTDENIDKQNIVNSSAADPQPDNHENCEAKISEFKNGWQRAVADYQNLKKETETRRAEWIQMSKEQILSEFIPVYDHFKTAFYHHPELNGDQKNIKNWVDGIGYIMKQFADVLKAHGIEEIKTVGETFNPAFHEAAGESDSDETVPDKTPGIIVREVSGGYKMGDKVIKPARVIISK